MYTRLQRELAILDFILEGHSLAEATDEFGISINTARADFNYLSYYAESNSKLMDKYQKAKKILKEIADKNRTNARINNRRQKSTE